MHTLWGSTGKEPRTAAPAAACGGRASGRDLGRGAIRSTRAVPSMKIAQCSVSKKSMLYQQLNNCPLDSTADGPNAHLTAQLTTRPRSGFRKFFSKFGGGFTHRFRGEISQNLGGSCSALAKFGGSCPPPPPSLPSPHPPYPYPNFNLGEGGLLYLGRRAGGGGRGGGSKL